ncbi:MAG TPA: NAD-dependent epimerase [Flavitalea sp.]|nr:NAD-dependent epimerase [Flavitalea sp.]
MKILVTGAAGFIGFHVVETLVQQGHEIIGLDVINDYYDVALKYGRLSVSGIQQQNIEEKQFVQSDVHDAYRFVKADLADNEFVMQLFATEKFDAVINLAAQAGVRYSLSNPQAYLQSNFSGFFNILEACRHNPVKHLVYASSSSVYGLNEKMPFSENDTTDHPISLYAASKKSNELMAHTYSHLFRIPTTGLRFFTVYGPWGRPDMALFLFTKAIFAGKSIQVFNEGKMERDFTFIDDIVDGIVRVLEQPARSSKEWDGDSPKPSISSAPYKVFNIGNSKPVKLMDFIRKIEAVTGIQAKIDFQPLQMGDVLATWADTSALRDAVNYVPKTSIDRGVERFVSWYKTYYNV